MKQSNSIQTNASILKNKRFTKIFSNLLRDLKEIQMAVGQSSDLTSDPLSLTFVGVSLNPIIVYCSTEEEMNNWFGLLKEQIEANGGNAIEPEEYTRIKVWYQNYCICWMLNQSNNNEHVKKKALIQVRVTNVGHYPLGFHKGVVSFVVTLTGFEDMFYFLF